MRNGEMGWNKGFFPGSNFIVASSKDNIIEDITVCCVEPYGRLLKIWCHDDNKRELALINDALLSLKEEFRESKGSVGPESLKKDVVYCCKSVVDDNWYRCKVIDFLNSGTRHTDTSQKLLIRFIDCGNTAEVNLSDLYYSAFPCLKLNPQVSEFILDDASAVDDNWSCESLSFCQRTLITKRVTIQIVGKYEDCRLVFLYVDDKRDSFNEQLVKEKMARRGPISPSDQASYLSYPLTVGQRYPCYVMRYTGVSRFYIQTKESREKYGWFAMMEELSRDIPAQQNLQYLKPGMPCFAYNDEKMRYARALINKMNDKAYMLYFVDFGNLDIKEREEIYKLPEKFTHIPTLAYECVSEVGVNLDWLHDLDENVEIECLVMNEGLPHKVKISQKSTIFKYDKINLEIGKEYEVSVTSIKNPCDFYLRLTQYEKKYNLLQAQLQLTCEDEIDTLELNAYETAPCCVWSTSDREWVRGEFVFVHGPNAQITFVDKGSRELTILGKHVRGISQESVNMMPALAIHCSMAHFSKDVKRYLSLEAKEFFSDLICDQTKLIANVIGMENDVAVVMLFHCNKKLCINEEILRRMRVGGLQLSIPKSKLSHVEEIYVTYYENVRRFYGQLTKINMDVLNTLQQKLNDYGKSLFLQQGGLFDGKSDGVGEFCCARYALDQQYYRGKVVSYVKDQADIYFVDYGNTEKIKVGDVKVLNSQLVSDPQMGIMCSSIDTISFGSNHNDIKNEILHQTLEVEIIGESDDDAYKVRFTESEKNAGIRKFIIQATDSSPPIPVVPKPSFISYKSLSFEETEKVELVHFRNWKKMYFHLDKYKDDLQKIERDIQIELIEHPKRNELGSVLRGMPCLAKFSVDQTWYRAVIDSVAPDDHLKVEFVDYGNQEMVPRCTTRPIPVELMKMPRQTFQCTLRSQPDEEVPEDILSKFEVEALNMNFVVHFTDVDASSTEAVEVEFKDSFGASLIAKYTKEVMSRFNPSHNYSPYYQQRNISNQENARGRSTDSEAVGGTSHVFTRSLIPSSGSDGRRSGPESRQDNLNFHNEGGRDYKTSRGDDERSLHTPAENNHSVDGTRPLSKLRQHPDQQNGNWGNSEMRVTDQQSGKKNYQENNGESRNHSRNSSSDNNWRGNGSNYNRQTRGNDRGNTFTIGQDGYGREIPPRFRNNDERNGDGDRKYNSRKFYPKDENRVNGDDQSRNNGDRESKKNYEPRSSSRNWYKDGHSGWDEGNGASTGFDRKPRRTTYNQEEGSKGRNTWNSEPPKLPVLEQCTVNIGEYKEVSIVYVVTPDEFYCNLVDYKNNDRYQTMSEQLNAKCREENRIPMLSECNVDTLCSAWFSDDENWYRARVVAINGDDIEVFFIDYGNSTLCQKSSLKVLESEFQVLPARAIKCSMYDLKSGVEDTWTTVEAIEFENLVIDSHFLAHFKSKSKSGVYFIDIIDSSLFSSLSVRYKLIAEKNFRPLSTTDNLYLTVASNSLCLNPYKALQVNVGQKEQAYVTWINSPEQFYCHLVRNEEESKLLETKLNSFYGALGNNELILIEHKRGTPCVAPFTFAGVKGWYRAFVLAIEDGQLIVHYVDYGNLDRVAANDVKQLDVQFLDIPAQAVLFSLNGIQPLGSQWKSVTNEDMKKYYDGDLECTAVSCDDNKYVVDVISNGKNIATELIKGGYVRAGSKFTPEVAPIINVVVSKMMGITTEHLNKIRITASNLAVNLHGNVNSSEVAVCDDALTDLPSTSNKTLINSESAAKSDSKGLSVGDSFMAAISFVKSTKSFWIQRVSDCEEVKLLNDILYTTYNESEPEEYVRLSPGDLCVARCKADGSWYRSKVLGELDFGLTVQYIDYGDVEWVLLDDIRLMPVSSVEWVTKSPFAFESKLDGLPLFPSSKCQESLNNAFNNFLESWNYQANANIVKQVGEQYCVRLTSLDKDLSEEIIKECEVDLTSEEFIPNKLTKIDHNSKTTLSAAISNVESPYHVWIQNADDAEALNQISEGLMNCNETASPLLPESLKRGMVVLTRYVDDYWYRAIVDSVSELTAKVTFADYGNTDDVNLADVKSLPEEFFKTPALAIECMLDGVEKSREGWSDDALQLLKSIESQGTVLQAEIVDIIDGIYSIVLRDGETVYNQLLTKSPSSSSDPTEKISVPVLQAKTRECSLGEKNMVSISHIISPSKFWIQLLSDEDQLSSLTEELNVICTQAISGMTTATQVEIGEVYAVQYLADECWYRGQILEETDDGFLVYFVDFGNSELVPPQLILKLEKPELINLHYFAIKCELSRESNSTDWTEEASAQFISEYSNVQCLAEFLEENDGTCVVHLLDMGINVAKKLLGDKCNSTLEVSESSVISDSSVIIESNVDTTCEDVKSELVEVIALDSELSSSLPISVGFSSSVEELLVDNADVGDHEEEIATPSRVETESDLETDSSVIITSSSVVDTSGFEEPLVNDSIDTEIQPKDHALVEQFESATVSVELEVSEAVVQLSDLSNIEKSIEIGPDVSADGFTSQLSIPSYSEFAENAANHPRSVSPLPDSSMDPVDVSSELPTVDTTSNTDTSSDVSSELPTVDTTSNTDTSSDVSSELPTVDTTSNTDTSSDVNSLDDRRNQFNYEVSSSTDASQSVLEYSEFSDSSPDRLAKIITADNSDVITTELNYGEASSSLHDCDDDDLEQCQKSDEMVLEKSITIFSGKDEEPNSNLIASESNAEERASELLFDVNQVPLLEENLDKSWSEGESSDNSDTIKDNSCDLEERNEEVSRDLEDLQHSDACYEPISSSAADEPIDNEVE